MLVSAIIHSNNTGTSGSRRYHRPPEGTHTQETDVAQPKPEVTWEQVRFEGELDLCFSFLFLPSSDANVIIYDTVTSRGAFKATERHACVPRRRSWHIREHNSRVPETATTETCMCSVSVTGIACQSGKNVLATADSKLDKTRH